MTEESLQIEYLTTREAAHILGATMEKVQKMARRGDIKGHKAGELAGMRGTVWRLEKASVDAARKATDRVMSEGPREVRFGDRRLVLEAGVADTIHRLRRAADFAAYGGCHFEPEPEPDPATRLLPFEDVDEHRIWPLAVYKVEESDEPECVDFCAFSIEGRGVMASGTYGNRAQAVEACRNDLRIRLAAVDELRGKGEHKNDKAVAR